jgi:hypothetical protein
MNLEPRKAGRSNGTGGLSFPVFQILSESSFLLTVTPTASSTPMPNYVDGFVLPLPTKNLAAYRAMAGKAGKIWKEYGALD